MKHKLIENGCNIFEMKLLLLVYSAKRIKITFHSYENVLHFVLRCNNHTPLYVLSLYLPLFVFK